MQPLPAEWSQLDKPRLIAITSVTTILENVFFHPWWVLKTREQVDSGSTNLNKTWLMANKIWKEGGRRAIFRGFWCNTLGSIPSYCVYLLVYHRMKHELTERSVTHGRYAPLAAGVAAELSSVGLMVPFDVVVQRLVVPNSPYANARQAFASIYRTEGIKGYFKGTGITAFVYSLGSGAWWFTYEHAKLFLDPILSRRPWHAPTHNGHMQPASGSAYNQGNGNALSPKYESLNSRIEKSPLALLSAAALPFISGLLAGWTATIMTNPFDVVKTRIQTQTALEGHSHSLGFVHYHGTLDGLRRIAMEEGWRGFTRGLIPKMISRGPLSAMSSIVYEVIIHSSLRTYL